MPRSLSTLEICAKLADIGLAHVARGSMRWEEDLIRIAVKPEDSRGLTKEVLTRISACLRIGCRCVLDVVVTHKQQVQLGVKCVNRFEALSDDSISDDECVDCDGSRGKSEGSFRE